MKQLFLIDSMAYIFRSFFAIRHMNGPDGTPTNAVFGFIKSFEKIVKDFNPQHLAAVFDAGSSTFRNEIYPAYKANRAECPEELKPQFEIIKEYLRLRGIPIIIQPGFEADDLIGTLANRGVNEGLDVVICTGDKDMMQLLSDKVKICQTHKENLWVDPAKVTELIGVRADQVIDYLAMTGDASDNIPGLPGIGPVMAAKLLNEFGTLENFFANPDKVSGKKALEAITQHQELGKLSKTLVTIKCDVELDCTINELVMSEPDLIGLENFFERLGMKQMKTDLDRLKQLANNKAKPSLAKALEIQANPCKVFMQTYAQTPQNYEITNIKIEIENTLFDLLEESGCESINDALLKFRDAFRQTDFSFTGETNFITGNKILEQKKIDLSFDYLVASWLFDSESALTIIDKFYNALLFNGLYQNGKFNEILQNSLVTLNDIKTNYILVNTSELLDKCLTTMKNAKNFAVDTETTSLKPFEAELVGIGFCCKKREAWYIPLNDSLNKEEILTKVKTLLENPAIFPFGQNIKYDYEVFLKHNITIANISFDTLIASYLLNPSSHFHDLDSQAKHYLNYTKIATKELIGSGSSQTTMNLVAIKDVCRYCCEDVDIAFQLQELHDKALKFKKLDKLFHKMDLPLVKILGDMEANGILIDQEKLKEMSLEFENKINLVTSEIYSLAGHEFNINSPKQVATVLFDELGLKSGKKTTSGYSTDASVLEELAAESEIVRKILDHRMLSKLKSTYIDALPTEVNPFTGRVHTHFSQTTAATGRLSSTSPNLQNIPTRTVEGKEIRSAFKPKPGYKFLACDYSQIELRIMAHLSEDPTLIDAFNRDLDIHTFTASLVFNVPENEVTKEQRYQAKAVNFGIIYGQGPYGLAKEIGVSADTAKKFISNYFMRYPKIQNYMQHAQHYAKNHGYAETAFGRQRFIPEINHPNHRLKAHGERVAINTPMQGTAADIIKLAMISIDKELKKNKLESKMLLQIHDELLFEVPENELNVMQKLIPKLMSEAATLKVKLKVDTQIGNNWSECD